MTAKYHDVNEYYREIPGNKGFSSPHNGAVFHTSRAYPQARAYVERHEGKCVVETTEYGRELDAQNLWQDDRFIEQNGVRGAKRVWDKASTEYASQSSGRVEVFCNGRIREKSTFARRELPVILNNEEVTHVNGIEREELKDVYYNRNKGKHLAQHMIAKADQQRVVDLDEREWGRAAGQAHAEFVSANTVDEHVQANKKLDALAQQAKRHPEVMDQVDNEKVKAELGKRIERERQREVQERSQLHERGVWS